MKRLFYLSIIALLFVSCMNQSKYTLTVKLDGVTQGTYYLMAREDGKWVKLDSIDITSPIAVFERSSIDFPEMQYIQLKGQRSMIGVFVENSNIEVIGDKKQSSEVVVKGSKSHDEYKAYQELEKPYEDKMQQFYADYREANQAGDKEKVEKLVETYDVLNGEKVGFIKNFVNENPKSIIASYLVTRNFYNYELEELEKTANLFDASIENSKYVKIIKKHVATLQSVAIGKKFVDFTMNDVNGNPVALSSVVGKGKYVLIDFWAAWCGPCRAENPNVVAIYNDYKDKGFDVIGISLDRKKEDWLKAIEDDKLTWTHLSDLEYWANAGAKLYGVNSIPHSVLVDPDGIIIDKNLREEKLREKIAELLD